MTHRRADLRRRERTLRSTGLTLGLMTAAIAGCTSPDTSPTSSQTTSGVAGLAVGSDAVTIAAAGDIARNPSHGEGTAGLIDELQPDAVLALGDLAYQNGSPAEFLENYDPTWGAFKAITRPIPGDHEYRTPEAAGYFDYFGSQIGGRSYYAWDAGTWRMYALNCAVDCGRDSAQVDWLRNDLEQHADRPALAYVHEPRYSCSTRHPPLRRLDDIWAALDEAQGALLLSGNNHAYERFAPLDGQGRPSPTGMRQFVVGTGGVSLYPLASPCPHREAEFDESPGVLRIDLEPNSYSWEFLSVDGQPVDSGVQRLP